MPCRAEKLALTEANSPSTGGHLFDVPILHPPRRPRVLFADSRLVADGLLLPATLAAQLGLRQSA